MNKFTEYLEMQIEGCKRTKAPYRDKIIYQLVLDEYKKQLTLTNVGSSFTFDEVEKLLKTQRGNCVVAVMKYITDDEILEKISDAPMYDYKKLKTKK